MGAAYASIHVGEGVELDASVHLSSSGVPRAWVYVDGHEAAVWGSPDALRRLAAALVIAADEADGLVAPVLGVAS